MIKVLLSMGLSMVALDIIWIKSWMAGLYGNRLGHLLRMHNGSITIEPLATALVYMIMVLGLFLLAVKPSHSVHEAMAYGAIAGLFSYGTFALTNHAIFKDWSWALTLCDMGWGTFLMAVVAGIGYYVGR